MHMWKLCRAFEAECAWENRIECKAGKQNCFQTNFDSTGMEYLIRRSSRNEGMKQKERESERACAMNVKKTGLIQHLLKTP